MIGHTDANESDEVLAFIAGRRGPVLRDATAELAEAPTTELPEVVHRLHGILGSYGLADAHEQIAELAAFLAEGSPDDVEADAARAKTVEALRALVAGLDA